MPNFFERFVGDLSRAATGFLPGVWEGAKAPILDIKDLVTEGDFTPEHTGRFAKAMFTGLKSDPILNLAYDVSPIGLVGNTISGKNPFSDIKHDALNVWEHPGDAALSIASLATAGAGSGIKGVQALDKLGASGKFTDSLMKYKGYKPFEGIGEDGFKTSNPTYNLSDGSSVDAKLYSLPKSVGDKQWVRQEYRTMLPSYRGKETEYTKAVDARNAKKYDEDVAAGKDVKEPSTISETISKTFNDTDSTLEPILRRRAGNERLARLGDAFQEKVMRELPDNWRYMTPGARWARSMAKRINPESAKAVAASQYHANATEGLKSEFEIGDDDLAALSSLYSQLDHKKIGPTAALQALDDLTRLNDPSTIPSEDFSMPSSAFQAKHGVRVQRKAEFASGERDNRYDDKFNTPQEMLDAEHNFIDDARANDISTADPDVKRQYNIFPQSLAHRLNDTNDAKLHREDIDAEFSKRVNGYDSLTDVNRLRTIIPGLSNISNDVLMNVLPHVHAATVRNVNPNIQTLFPATESLSDLFAKRGAASVADEFGLIHSPDFSKIGSVFKMAHERVGGNADPRILRRVRQSDAYRGEREKYAHGLNAIDTIIKLSAPSSLTKRRTSYKPEQLSSMMRDAAREAFDSVNKLHSQAPANIANIEDVFSDESELTKIGLGTSHDIPSDYSASKADLRKAVDVERYLGAHLFNLNGPYAPSAGILDQLAQVARDVGIKGNLTQNKLKHLVANFTSDKARELSRTLRAEGSHNNLNKARAIGQILLPGKTKAADIEKFALAVVNNDALRDVFDSAAFLSPGFYATIALGANKPWMRSAINMLESNDSASRNAALDFIIRTSRESAVNEAIIGASTEGLGAHEALSTILGNGAKRGEIERHWVPAEKKAAYNDALNAGNYREAIVEHTDLVDTLTKIYKRQKLANPEKLAREAVETEALAIEHLAKRVESNLDNDSIMLDTDPNGQYEVDPARQAYYDASSLRKGAVLTDEEADAFDQLKNIFDEIGITGNENQFDAYKDMIRGTLADGISFIKDQIPDLKLREEHKKIEHADDKAHYSTRAKDKEGNSHFTLFRKNGKALEQHGINDFVRSILSDPERLTKLEAIVASPQFDAFVDANEKVASLKKSAATNELSAIHEITAVNHKDNALAKFLGFDQYDTTKNALRENPFYHPIHSINDEINRMDKFQPDPLNGRPPSSSNSMGAFMRWHKTGDDGWEPDFSPDANVNRMKSEVKAYESRELAKHVSGLIRPVNMSTYKDLFDAGEASAINPPGGVTSRRFIALDYENPILSDLTAAIAKSRAALADTLNNAGDAAAVDLKNALDSLGSDQITRFINDAKDGDVLLMPTDAFRALKFEAESFDSQVLSSIRNATRVLKQMMLYLRPAGFIRNNLMGASFIAGMHEGYINISKALWKARFDTEWKRAKAALTSKAPEIDTAHGSSADARATRARNVSKREKEKGKGFIVEKSESFLEGHPRASEAISKAAERGGKISAGWDKYTNWVIDLNNKVADSPWRIARGLRELEKMYPDYAAQVLKSRGEHLSFGEAAEEMLTVPFIRERVVERTLGDMVDFTGMNRIEREVLMTIFPFWSWIKGSSKSFYRLGTNSPVKLKAGAELGQIGYEEQLADHGPVQGEKGFGILDGPGKYGFDLAGMNPAQTPVDLITMVGQNIPYVMNTREYGSNNMLSSMNPLIGAVVSGNSGKNLFFGTPINDGSPGTTMLNTLAANPFTNTLRQFVTNENSPRSQTVKNRFLTALNYAGVPIVEPNWNAIQQRGYDESYEKFKDRYALWRNNQQYMRDRIS